MTYPTYKVNSCCCDCSLRTGAYIIGLFQIVSAAFMMVFMGLVELIPETNPPPPSSTDPDTSFDEVTILVMYILFAFHINVCVLLIIGVKKNKPTLLLVWIVYTLGMLSLVILDQLYHAFMKLVLFQFGEAFFDAHLAIICSVPTLYFVLIVQSLYLELTEDNVTQV